MIKETRHAAFHYLVAIDEIRRDSGYARPVDLARRLGLTRGTVSITVRSLLHRGWVTRDANGFLVLTPEGQRHAQSTRLKNLRLGAFFRSVLGLPPDQAELDCRRIDHVLSQVAAQRICSLMRYLEQGTPVARRFLREFEEFSKGRLESPCEVCSEVCVLGTSTEGEDGAECPSRG